MNPLQSLSLNHILSHRHHPTLALRPHLPRAPIPTPTEPTRFRRTQRPCPNSLRRWIHSLVHLSPLHQDHSTLRWRRHRRVPCVKSHLSIQFDVHLPHHYPVLLRRRRPRNNLSWKRSGRWNWRTRSKGGIVCLKRNVLLWEGQRGMLRWALTTNIFAFLPRIILY